jgi:hypothetical protein
MTRRSPSYEIRLAKYGSRGFEVEVKDLNRDMVDPGIFECPWNALEGLAKMLFRDTSDSRETHPLFLICKRSIVRETVTKTDVLDFLLATDGPWMLTHKSVWKKN